MPLLEILAMLMFYDKTWSAINKLSNYAFDTLSQKIVDNFADAIVMGIGGQVYTSYKIVTLAWDVVAKYAGLYDDVEALVTYEARLHTYYYAYSLYTSSFEAIENGDTSSTAIAKLYQYLEFTKTAAIRALSTLKTVNSPAVPSDDYINNMIQTLNRISIN